MDIEEEPTLEDEPAETEVLEPETLGPESINDEDRLLILFAYMGPLALVSLLLTRREFVRWHAVQGLLLGALTLATFVVLRPFHTLFFRIWPFLGQVFMTIEILTGVGFFLVAVVCLVRGVQGTRFRIPFLADFVDRF